MYKLSLSILAVCFATSVAVLAEPSAVPREELDDAAQKLDELRKQEIESAKREREDRFAREREDLEKWCAELDQSVARFRWGLAKCDPRDWMIGGRSIKGRPLVYTRMGVLNSPNSTMVVSMVHGDEITPLYVAMRLIEWLKNNPKALERAQIAIAPLVNPDSYYADPKTRTNARGVDVNRNFPTADWENRALKAWKGEFKSTPRRFPGNRANSEPETQFQMAIISETQPQKVISIHSPLNFLDYDGPAFLHLDRFPKDYVEQCAKLKAQVRAISGRFFVGSLGNWAGQERGIPTFTLELPSSDPSQALKYWEKFRTGIETVVRFEVPSYVTVPLPMGPPDRRAEGRAGRRKNRGM